MSAKPNGSHDGDGQIVLVLQGGGALGAFQAGVYQALHEAGMEPDWVIGTSIGAINAALIAGNTVENRLQHMREFWDRMADKSVWNSAFLLQHLSQQMAYWRTLTSGIPGFFDPNPRAFFGPHVQLGAEEAGYYSTAPLEQTLRELVDFSIINDRRPRLTVGAAKLRTSEMKYFDSRDMPIGPRHILASGALPPAFPAVRIDGELYWDGGILSNTPSEVVFDDNPRRNSLIFAVHLWNPNGPEPETIWDVLHRHKDIQYSSRVANHITRQSQIHRLRHVIKQLAAYIPDKDLTKPAVKELMGYGCLTRMQVVRLLVPMIENEDHTKDVDFSPDGIRSRWEAGYASTRASIAARQWEAPTDLLEGVTLYEPVPPAAAKAPPHQNASAASPA